MAFLAGSRRAEIEEHMQRSLILSTGPTEIIRVDILKSFGEINFSPDNYEAALVQFVS